MLIIKTYIAKSPLHGLGLFAAEDIAADVSVWKFTESFDKTFTREEIEHLPATTQIFLAKYAYKSRRTGRYLLDSDNARYFNHTESPNTATRAEGHSPEDVIYTLRNIKAGEEITMDYNLQEQGHAQDNILETFYEKYGLKDEVDPRLKKEARLS